MAAFYSLDALYADGLKRSQHHKNDAIEAHLRQMTIVGRRHGAKGDLLTAFRDDIFIST